MERHSPHDTPSGDSVGKTGGKLRLPGRGHTLLPEAAGKKGIENAESRKADESRRGELAFFWMECAAARRQAGLTQQEIAERMGTTGSAVARLEAYRPGKRPAPTLETLRRYAEALGCRLIVRLEAVEQGREPKKS